jgi:hypothetical protein
MGHPYRNSLTEIARRRALINHLGCIPQLINPVGLGAWAVLWGDGGSSPITLFPWHAGMDRIGKA